MKIKSAIVYKAELPSPEALEKHLKDGAFVEPAAHQVLASGFVPGAEHGPFVRVFPGGLSFCVRIDEKVVPGSAIKEAVAKLSRAWQEQTGRERIPKSVRAQLKREVTDDLSARALARTRIVECFRHTESRLLIVSTTSKKTADVCTALLVNAVGSVKTETINVPEAQHGLTTRLKAWLAGEHTFYPFAPCDQASLEAEGRKFKVKMHGLEGATRGIEEAIGAGASVTSIGLAGDGIWFRLSHDFRLSGIAFTDRDIPEEEEDLWASDAAIQVGRVVEAIEVLSELLSYKEAAE
jgi:recombination associated protein RdgC